MIGQALANLRVRTKLFLMMLLPIASLAFFAISGISEKAVTARQSSEIVTISTLAKHLSALVHELQRERGSTGIFLGSHGATFSPELRAQRLELGDDFADDALVDDRLERDPLRRAELGNRRVAQGRQRLGR